MEKGINIPVTKTELAAIVSALDFTLIKSTGEQFTEDYDILSFVYTTIDEGYSGDDGHTSGLYDFTKALASRLASLLVEEAT